MNKKLLVLLFILLSACTSVSLPISTTTTSTSTTSTTISIPSPPPPAPGGWLKLRLCESGNNYTINTGNGYYGAYQFAIPTWDFLQSGYDRADHAPYWVQDAMAMKLYRLYGLKPWPTCGPKSGLA